MKAANAKTRPCGSLGRFRRNDGLFNSAKYHETPEKPGNLEPTLWKAATWPRFGIQGTLADKRDDIERADGMNLDDA